MARRVPGMSVIVRKREMEKNAPLGGEKRAKARCVAAVVVVVVEIQDDVPA
jgi:hypothetical protein